MKRDDLRKIEDALATATAEHCCCEGDPDRPCSACKVWYGFWRKLGLEPWGWRTAIAEEEE